MKCLDCQDLQSHFKLSPKIPCSWIPCSLHHGSLSEKKSTWILCHGFWKPKSEVTVLWRRTGCSVPLKVGSRSWESKYGCAFRLRLLGLGWGGRFGRLARNDGSAWRPRAKARLNYTVACLTLNNCPLWICREGGWLVHSGNILPVVPCCDTRFVPACSVG